MQETGVQSLGWKGEYGNALRYSCLEDHHGQRSLVGYSPQGHRESDITERLSTTHRFEMASYSWSCNNELSQGRGFSEDWNPRLGSIGSVLAFRALWCLNDASLRMIHLLIFFFFFFYSPKVILRWHPLHYSWLENPMDRGAWRATGLQRVGHAWSDLVLMQGPKRSWLFLFSVS